jgi:hypothetical protein
MPATGRRTAIPIVTYGTSCSASRQLLSRLRAGGAGVTIWPNIARSGPADWAIRCSTALAVLGVAAVAAVPGVVISPADHALQRTPAGAERSLRINSFLRVI